MDRITTNFLKLNSLNNLLSTKNIIIICVAIAVGLLLIVATTIAVILTKRKKNNQQADDATTTLAQALAQALNPKNIANIVLRNARVELEIKDIELIDTAGLNKLHLGAVLTGNVLKIMIKHNPKLFINEFKKLIERSSAE